MAQVENEGGISDNLLLPRQIIKAVYAEACKSMLASVRVCE